MSASSQRMRKSSPCSTSKQGPMRATLPVSSLLRQSRQQQQQQQQNASSGSLRKSNSNSPTTATSLSPINNSTTTNPTTSSSTSTNTNNNANANTNTTSTWRSRGSPDTSSSTNSGQRSPGSLSYKGYFAAKSKTLSGRCSDSLSGNQNIRRTASLDTIYLKGQWPRDTYYNPTTLLVDKATQTEDWPNEPRKPHSRHPTPTDQTIPDEKLEKYFRHRLQRTNKEGTSSRERTAAFGLIMPPVAGDHSVLLPSIASQTSTYNQISLSGKANSMIMSMKPMRPPMRSSIEGLNQEIEGLVLKSGNGCDSEHHVEDKYGRFRDQMTPEGHRAPLADLFWANRSVNSVNTQTPATDLPSSSYSSGGSRGSTPDHDRESGRLGTSPQINRFLAREPPDGCEKVSTKFIEDVRRPTTDLSKLDYCSKPIVAFQLKPSLGSAFLPLQQSVNPTSSNSPSTRTTPTTPPPNP